MYMISNTYNDPELLTNQTINSNRETNKVRKFFFADNSNRIRCEWIENIVLYFSFKLLMFILIFNVFEEESYNIFRVVSIYREKF